MGTDVLGSGQLGSAVGARCDAVIGQLTERWDAPLLRVLAEAGGKVFSNYAVGYDNVDVDAATRLKIPVGNTPGVLTETTAELAVALTLATARRIPEGDRFMRAGQFGGWLPRLMLGRRMWRGTVGIVGAGRIGETYARMMLTAHHMDVIYFDVRRNEDLERDVEDFGDYLVGRSEERPTCTRARSLRELIEAADIVSVHAALTAESRHLIGARELAWMKQDGVLVNTSRGALIDEAALVAHCRQHPRFRVALDVFENEPALEPGLAELDNVVLVPHLGSATDWTRSGMATLAASNVVAMLEGWPVWPRSARWEDVAPFLDGASQPRSAPSIVNAAALGLAVFPDGPGRREE